MLGPCDQVPLLYLVHFPKPRGHRRILSRTVITELSLKRITPELTYGEQENDNKLLFLKRLVGLLQCNKSNEYQS